jgi:GNAT superfamily N-acetyltransferase
MGATLAALEPADLAAACDVLHAACAHDKASLVAEEKLFGASPRGMPTAIGARKGGILIGVAATCGDRIRVLAVHPAARGEGIGGMLLKACEEQIWQNAARRARLLDEPGNYLAPGVDMSNADTIRWLEHKGYVCRDKHINLIVDVKKNPKVSAERAADLAARAAAQGYEVRRGAPHDSESLSAAISMGFGGAWPFEIERALCVEPPGVHVAWHDGRPAAFAAHDGNNQGLGWFGPAGTWPEHRGHGLGEALLIACLVDIAAAHDTAEIAWVGPREFYEKAVGVIGERTFAVMTKDSPFKRATIPPL